MRKRTALFLTVVVGAAAFVAPASAAPIVLETPAIIEGDPYTSTSYSGRISIAAETDDPGFGSDKTAEYSLDGGAHFFPATIENPSGLVLVNTTTFREQVTPVIATLAGGGSVVAWASFSNDGSGFGIFARRTDAQGAPAGGEFQVNTFVTLDQSQPALAALADGGFVIAWSSVNEDGSSFAVVAQRYDSDGARAGGPFRVNDHVPNAQLRPAIAGLADGGFVVAWQSLDQLGAGTGYHIFSKRYDAQGAAVPPPGGCVAGNCETRVDDVSRGNQTDPAVTSVGPGGFVITWTGEGSGQDADDEVYGRMFVANPEAPTTGFLLRSPEVGPGKSQRTTAVAPWGDGGFAAVWVSPGAPTEVDVYLQVFTADGVPVIGGGARDQLVNLVTAGNQATPTITASNDGGLLVAWADASTATRSIKARRFDARPAPISGELTIAATTAGSASNPTVAVSPQGSFLTTWEAIGNPADPSSSGIFSRRMSKALLVKRDLTPGVDIDLQFRLTDPALPGQSWLSPIRRYRYGDPASGADGAVVYADGFTSAATAFVGLILPDIPIGFQSVQLHQRLAPLAAGQCGDYEQWQEVGRQTTLTRTVEIALADATCNQFKWKVVNGLDTELEYLSPNVLGVDRLAPLVIAVPQQLGGVLRVTVSAIEPISGIASQVHVTNRGQPVAFSSNTALIPLRDGANSIRIEVTDRAGNVGTSGFFFTADLTPPAIALHTIEEGKTYGGELALLYTLTQPLTDLTVLVDGVVTDATDLSFLPDGAHQVTIRGFDSQGQLVERSVSFTIDRSQFSLSLLSPQARTYPEDEVVVTVSASRPLAETTVTLDGVLQRDLILRDLANGEHTVIVEATSADGAIRSVARTFHVAVEAPALAISHPVDGEVLPSRSLRLEFDSNSPVEYRVGDAHGTAVSGSIITLPEDGPQQLTLTAIHPNGTVLSRSINVSVDSLAPALTIVSPTPQLYAARSIPIEVRANKSLRQLVTRLDGAPVTSLDELADGAHQLEILATDLSGREVRAVVPFQVAHLEIVAPRPGEKIIDNHLPPVVQLQWEAGGNFTTLTAAVDGGEEQLLPAGTTAPLQLMGGSHEVVVRGRLNELVLARSVRFKAGARNVRVNQNAIKYSFTNCDDELLCDVDVMLQIENIGDYDFAEDVPVLFEVVDAGGGSDGEVRAFEWVVDGIVAKEKRIATLSTFRARLEDTFRISVDPQRTIPAEDTRDNTYEVVFQPGKILDVKSALSDANFYVSAARTDNLFAVATVGPVAFVELQAGDNFFRDSSGAQGFASPVDMGMLTPAANYVIIKAYSATNQLLDSRIEYFDVRSMHASYPVSSRSSPWRFFLGAGNRIFVDQIDQRELARAELRGLRESLGEDAITIYRAEDGVDAEGRQKITYGITHSDSPSLQRSGEPRQPSGLNGANGAGSPLGFVTATQPLGPGTKAVGSFTRLSLANGACMVSGFSAIASSAAHKQSVTDGLDDFAAGVNVLIDTVLQPQLEKEIEDAFNELENVLEPFTRGFGLGVVAPGFFAFVVGDIDLIPPNVSNIRFQFEGEIEDFLLEAGVSSCEVRLVGTEIFVDSEVDFEMRFRRRFSLSADVSGGGSGFAFGGLGIPIPIPDFAVFGFVYARLQLMGPTFVGAVTVDAHYSGGLRGRLLAPSLTIDHADVFLGLRVPLQMQRVAEGDVYAFIWVPFISWFFIVGAHADIEAFAEVQAETVFDNHLQAPIVLANPSYRFGVLPDTDSFTSPTGHVFAKARSIVNVELSVCIWFICIPIADCQRIIPITDTCLKVQELSMVPGSPGIDCPYEVTGFPFPRSVAAKSYAPPRATWDPCDFISGASSPTRVDARRAKLAPPL